jgi:hypothetical protein
MNSNTVGGLLAYCDWLLDKHYATLSQIKPWRIAIHKVFGAVADGGPYEDISLEDVDLDDTARRFRTYGAQTYKSESIDAYLSRVRRAIEAYEYWKANDRPPVFRQVSKKADGDEAGKAKKPTQKSGGKKPDLRLAENGAGEQDPPAPQEPGFIEYPFPLRSGKIAKLVLPQRLEKVDVDRMVQLLHALQFEPQSQIPERTGEQDAA